MDYKTLKELGAKPRKKLKFTVEVSKRCPPEYTLRIPEENVIEQLPTVTKKLLIPTSTDNMYFVKFFNVHVQ
jgi:hypothetical protein